VAWLLLSSRMWPMSHFNLIAWTWRGDVALRPTWLLLPSRKCHWSRLLLVYSFLISIISLINMALWYGCYDCSDSLILIVSTHKINSRKLCLKVKRFNISLAGTCSPVIILNHEKWLLFALEMAAFHTCTTICDGNNFIYYKLLIYVDTQHAECLQKSCINNLMLLETELS
jgi:hypothetical protein